MNFSIIQKRGLASGKLFVLSKQRQGVFAEPLESLEPFFD